jgi:hypothetical protein
MSMRAELEKVLSQMRYADETRSEAAEQDSICMNEDFLAKHGQALLMLAGGEAQAPGVRDALAASVLLSVEGICPDCRGIAHRDGRNVGRRFLIVNVVRARPFHGRLRPPARGVKHDVVLAEDNDHA